MLDSVLRYLDANAEVNQERLLDLLRIASISADSAYAAEVQRAAQWVDARFREMGLASQVIATDRHPLVYAESPPVDSAPTVLVYGHYDVQPPDPLEKWTTPPFEPDIRDGNVYARGATDDKGQMLTHVASAGAWLEATGTLPLQVKFLIEGEEEIGSESLGKYLAQNAEQLRCDCVVISDTSQFAPGVPAITYGLRGIAYYELFLQGPSHDLHSGVFGGAVTNPAVALSKMLAGLVDDHGRITLPGFYDSVAELTSQERSAFSALPFDETMFRAQVGVDALGAGEAAYTPLERRWARPSFDVHGMTSGYQGEGEKTVLPATASAKFSFRLVPNQDPEKVTLALEARLAELLPPGATMRLKTSHGGAAIAMPLESPYLQAAADAIETGFGSRPVFIREGGSIPIVSTFVDVLDADILLLGWGQNDDNPHSPNEKFSLDDFRRGTRASAALWDQLAKLSPA